MASLVTPKIFTKILARADLSTLPSTNPGNGKPWIDLSGLLRSGAGVNGTIPYIPDPSPADGIVAAFDGLGGLKALGYVPVNKAGDTMSGLLITRTTDYEAIRFGSSGYGMGGGWGSRLNFTYGNGAGLMLAVEPNYLWTAGYLALGGGFGGSPDSRLTSVSSGVVKLTTNNGTTLGTLQVATIDNPTGLLVLTSGSGGNGSLRIDLNGGRVRWMDQYAYPIDIQSNDAVNPLLRVTASGVPSLSIYADHQRIPDNTTAIRSANHRTVGFGFSDGYPVAGATMSFGHYGEVAALSSAGQIGWNSHSGVIGGVGPDTILKRAAVSTVGVYAANGTTLGTVQAAKHSTANLGITEESNAFAFRNNATTNYVRLYADGAVVNDLLVTTIALGAGGGRVIKDSGGAVSIFANDGVTPEVIRASKFSIGTHFSTTDYGVRDGRAAWIACEASAAGLYVDGWGQFAMFDLPNGQVDVRAANGLYVKGSGGTGWSQISAGAATFSSNVSIGNGTPGNQTLTINGWGDPGILFTPQANTNLRWFVTGHASGFAIQRYDASSYVSSPISIGTTDTVTLAGNLLGPSNFQVRGQTYLDLNIAGATILGIGASTLDIAGTLRPSADLGQDLGSSARRWNNLYGGGTATFNSASYPLGAIKIRQGDGTGPYTGRGTASMGISFYRYYDGWESGAIYSDNSGVLSISSGFDSHISPYYDMRLIAAPGVYGIKTYGDTGLAVRNRADSADAPITAGAATFSGAITSAVTGAISNNLTISITGGTGYEAGIILRNVTDKWQIYDSAGQLRIYNYGTASEALSILASDRAVTMTANAGSANLTLANGGEATLRFDSTLAGAHVWGISNSAGSFYIQHATTRPFGGTIISPFIIAPTGRVAIDYGLTVTQSLIGVNGVWVDSGASVGMQYTGANLSIISGGQQIIRGYGNSGSPQIGGVRLGSVSTDQSPYYDGSTVIIRPQLATRSALKLEAYTAQTAALLDVAGFVNIASTTASYRLLQLTGSNINTCVTLTDATASHTIGVQNGIFGIGTGVFHNGNIIQGKATGGAYFSDSTNLYGTGLANVEQSVSASTPGLHLLLRGVPAGTEKAIQVTSGGAYTTEVFSLKYNGSATFAGDSTFAANLAVGNNLTVTNNVYGAQFLNSSNKGVGIVSDTTVSLQAGASSASIISGSYNGDTTISPARDDSNYFGDVVIRQGGAERVRVTELGATFSNDIIQTPSASITPSNNGQLTFEATSNTSLTVKYKGSDGTVRSVVLTLAP